MINQMAKKINDAGGRLYLVGGAIRDEIMNIKSEDLDFCITGLDENDLYNLFKDVKKVGSSFPVYIINSYECALARKETKIKTGHKGFNFDTSKEITIYDDLKRRDITINAIAKDVITNEIIDPFNGIEDIKNHIIKHISNSFCEDGLRVYRVARFSAKYNFKVDVETIKLMSKLKDEIKYLKNERIFEELKKALKTDHPSNFFHCLINSDILDIHFFELNFLFKQNKTLFNNLMKSLDEIVKYTKDDSVIFSILSLGTYLLNINDISIINLCKRLNLPKKYILYSQDISNYLDKAINFNNLSNYEKIILLNKLKKSHIGIQNFEIILNIYFKFFEIPKSLKKNFELLNLSISIFTKINGKTLNDNGIYSNKIGYKKFLDILYKKQAEYIDLLTKNNK